MNLEMREGKGERAEKDMTRHSVLIILIDKSNPHLEGELNNLF